METVKLENLESLNLSFNQISNITIFEKLNFKKLKKLFLCNNDIFAIDVLENVNFENLEEIDLGYNKISDINILENANFPKLKILYLYGNNISEIKVLYKINVEIINISNNKINIEENNEIISYLKSFLKEFIY